MTFAQRLRLLLLAAVAATASLYWPGLSGPYLFDDYWNLAPIERWHAGDQGWLTTLLPNQDSLVDSRPVAMASFMLTTWLGGVGTFPLKTGNLAIHLACGLLGAALLHRILRLDVRLASHAGLLSTVAAVIWLLHPLHVSTVLYSVQRMTQLAALFTLAALMVYLIGRRQLEAGRTRLAVFNFFVAFPLLLGLGTLSKQNAATAGLLCLILEWTYLARPRQKRVLVCFFAAFVALPALAVASVLSFWPQRLLGGYAGWDFTLSQRLLTQPRALWDYIGMWVVPRTPKMGLYTDGFPVSTGLLSPPSTLLAILALVATSVLAVAVRRRAPSVTAGWFFFLAAHIVESSFLPIEMYYEHRNYLPSFGLLIMLAGFWSLLQSTLRAQSISSRVAAVGVAALCLVLAFSSLGRVLVWQSEVSMLTQGIQQHPESFRAKLDLAVLHLRNEDYAAAKESLTPLLQSDNPRERLVVEFDLAAVECASSGHVDPAAMKRAVKHARPMLTIYEVHAVRQLENLTAIGKCIGSAKVVADAFSVLLDAAWSQPESDHSKMHIRKMTAQVYARAGRWETAEHHAKVGWKGNADPPTGGLLVRIYLRNGKRQQAQAVFDALKVTIRPFDTDGQRELAILRSLLEEDAD